MGSVTQAGACSWGASSPPLPASSPTLGRPVSTWSGEGTRGRRSKKLRFFPGAGAAFSSFSRTRGPSSTGMSMSERRERVWDRSSPAGRGSACCSRRPWRGSSSGRYSYRGRLNIQSATSKMVRLQAARAMNTPAMAQMMVHPREENRDTQHWASSPPSTPPEDSFSPVVHRLFTSAPSQARGALSRPWSSPEKTRGSSNAQLRRRRTGRPR